MEETAGVNMKTERLFLRERTIELLKDLRSKPFQEQLDFFGFDNEKRLQHEWNRLDKGLSNWRIEFKVWDLIDLETNKVIGYFGYHSWYVWHKRAEIGAFLNAPYRKKGYMGEALRRIIQYGFEEMGLNRIEGLVHAENLPSINMIVKEGFLKEGVFRECARDNDVLVDMTAYSLIKSDYLKNKGN